MRKLFAASIVGLLFIAPMSNPASARQELRIQVDESQMMVVPGAPGAIIIGNPSIADVSIQGAQIFIHGRGFGQTNLTILDLQGNSIVDFDVMVSHTQVSNVAVFKGPDRLSYSCAPYCEAEIQVGDNGGFFDTTSDQLGKKMKLATGSNTAEAQAPAAPQ